MCVFSVCVYLPSYMFLGLSFPMYHSHSCILSFCAAAPRARRRDNYGGRLDGPWILGMVWKGPTGVVDVRCFHVQRRDAATLIPIIKAHVLPGTSIWTDEWRAYTRLEDHGFFHSTVNHSEAYVDPFTRVNTQLIECLWGHIKHKVTLLLLPFLHLSILLSFG